MLLDQTPIIFYHNISSIPRKAKIKGAFTSPAKFRKQMEFLRMEGYQTVFLEDITDWMEGISELPQKPIAITFDDGYRDNFVHAFPILLEYGFKATFFIVPALIGKRNEWAVQKGEIDKPLMSLEEISILKENGFRFGSHTMNHQVLTAIDPYQARQEIIRSKEVIEEFLDGECCFLAYPAGSFDKAIVNMAKEAGYKGALTTQPGFVLKDSDPFMMTRFEVKRRQSSKLKFLIE
jgi:peptidoglycan/xylan/chitin deacetylase (PgdA/CDA1 family)